MAGAVLGKLNGMVGIQNQYILYYKYHTIGERTYSNNNDIIVDNLLSYIFIICRYCLVKFLKMAYEKGNMDGMSDVLYKNIPFCSYVDSYQ